jgi:serine/threonine protein kinase
MLHHFGYAHRDIKPENFLRVGDEWKLCDFGLTKSVKDSSLMTKHIGSANYMAPELLISNN